MNSAWNRRKLLGAAAGALGAVATGMQWNTAYADKSAVKMKNWEGAIDYQPDGPSPFMMHGTASHLGTFTADGEVWLVPTEVEGLWTGEGPVIFTAANGDQLVGHTTWFVDENNNSSIRFAWRDSVEFSDGTVVNNTGRFETDRPPGLVVIAIIAILIGMLLPAVQKVR